MGYIPMASRSNFPIEGYEIDFENCTNADISRFKIRVAILEEWQYCETPNEVYYQTNHAKYHNCWHKKRGEK